MKKLTIKKIALIAFKAGKTQNNLLSFLKSYKKDEQAFYLKNEDGIRKELGRLISLQDAKAKKDELIKQAKKIKLPVKKLVEYQAKANRIAACFSAGYSMGGDIRVTVVNGKFWAENMFTKEKHLTENKMQVGYFSNKKEYSKSCTYRATHSSHDITLTPGELDTIEIIGGIPTQILENKKISNCNVWAGIGDKQHYRIEKMQNFITGDYHSASYNHCEIWRKNRALSLLKTRHDAIAIENKIKAASSKFVGLNDSIKAGNCLTGSVAFAAKHNLNPLYGYNLGYLLKIEPTNIFLLRML